MTKRVIAIVGMPGAGKSEASSFFTQKGFPSVRFGSAIDDGLKEEGLERNAKNEQYMREKIRNEGGMAGVAKRVMPKIQKALEENDIVILDGLYSWEEYIYLQKEIGEIFLLCMYARPTIRYQRLAGRSIRPFTAQESRQRDMNEIERTNKGGPIAIADYLIKNETTKEDFINELETFFATL